jgi:hypothetical protein
MEHNQSSDEEEENIEEGKIEREQEQEESGSRDIYRWPLRQTEEETKEEQRTLAAQKVISPGQEARVSQVTHNLVQWGGELGGSEQAPGIDEATVKGLFSSDYETRVRLISHISCDYNLCSSQ